MSTDRRSASGIDDRSTDEKIDLASLWDRITTHSGTIGVLEWHREMIAERLRDLDSDPPTNGMLFRSALENDWRRSVSRNQARAAAIDAVR
jgi:hypothetical protein